MAITPKSELKLTEALFRRDCTRAEATVAANPSQFSDKDIYEVAKCFFKQGDAEHLDPIWRAEPLFKQLVTSLDTTPRIRAKSIYGLGKGSGYTGQTQFSLPEYEKKFEADVSDVDSLCHIAQLSRIDAPSSELGKLDREIQYVYDSIPKDPWTYICLIEYARDSTTLSNAAEIADYSCQALLGFSDNGFPEFANKSFSFQLEIAKNPLNPASDFWREPQNWVDYFLGLSNRPTPQQVKNDQESYWLNRLQKNPKDLDALHGLTEAYYKRGLQSFAINPLTVATQLETDMTRNDSIDTLARTYYVAGEYEIAKSVWEQLKAIPGMETRYEFGMAMIELRSMHFDEAMAHFKAANMDPSPFHRLASGARIAALLSNQDYSRVGKSSVKVFEKALEWCEEHLKQYPKDRTVLHTWSYVNWRVQEAYGHPLQMVSDRVQMVIDNGRLWDGPISGMEIVYAALSYIHRGKGTVKNPELKEQAETDFVLGEKLLAEVIDQKDELIKSGDSLSIYNVGEAQLSLAWSKFYQGKYAESAKIFASVGFNPKELNQELNQENSAIRLTEADRAYAEFNAVFHDKALLKQKIEALRGYGDCVNRIARDRFASKAYGTAIQVAEHSVKILQDALKLEADERAKGYVEPQFSFNMSRTIVDGSWNEIDQEEKHFVETGYHFYLKTLSSSVRNETLFTLATARHWQAKCLGAADKGDAAVVVRNQAQADFKAVVDAAPDHGDSHRFLTAIAVLNKNYQDALGHYRQAMQLGNEEPANAAFWIIRGANESIDDFNKGTVQSNSAVSLKQLMIDRVEFGIVQAIYQKSESSLDEALRYATAVATNDDICDPESKASRKALLAMIDNAKKSLESSDLQERKSRTRIYQKIISKLQPCLTKHHITATDVVVSLAPAPR